MENRISFDLVRITAAKREVGVCSNTIRAYAREGLAIYHKGRAAFFSRTELAEHIRRTATREIVKGAA